MRCGWQARRLPWKLVYNDEGVATLYGPEGSEASPGDRRPGRLLVFSRSCAGSEVTKLLERFRAAGLDVDYNSDER